MPISKDAYKLLNFDLVFNDYLATHYQKGNTCTKQHNVKTRLTKICVRKALIHFSEEPFCFIHSLTLLLSNI